MASSSENLNLEAWGLLLRPPTTTFGDSWISEAFARDTETLTKALQKSLSNHNHNHNHHHPTDDENTAILNLVNHVSPPPPTTTVIRTPSSVSGSDAETTTPPPPPPPSKRQNTIPVNVTGGKTSTKRKSRASKRTTTTFIMADPANFRQMVQQVTGVKFFGTNTNTNINSNSNSNSNSTIGPLLLKPEPHRPFNMNRFHHQGCLPSTLDTSAFLLDHHHHLLGPTEESSGPPPAMVADGASSAFDFDSFSSFPTLESWKVM